MKRSSLLLLPLAAASLGGLTLLAACGDDEGSGDAVTQVDVTLSDFAFTMPKTVAAGPTRWTAKNTGQQEHQITIGRLNDGATLAQVIEALSQPEGGEAAALALVTLYGTPQSVAPGSEVTTLVDLPAGDYMALCFIPDPADGLPHFAKGMTAEFKVEGTGSGTALPKEPVIKLSEFKFEVPEKIDWNKPVRIDNVGAQHHEIAIYKIADGKTLDDVLAFLGSQTPSGPPPFSPAGGITGMNPGTSAAVDLKLAKGNYAFLCFFTDPASGAPHFVQGMAQQVTVA